VVEIEIIERVPVARWQAANGSFLVDDQGVVVAEAMASATGSATSGPPGWPAALAVRDTTGRDVRPGDRVDQRALLAARELARALPAAGAGVKEVEYSAQGLVFVTDGGCRVIVGDTEALNAKLANLAAILELARAQDLKLAVVDLRPKERPFYQVAP
jgi:cell division septal protein FtsQ